MIAKFQKKTVVTAALTTTLATTVLALTACGPAGGTSASSSVSEVSRLQVMSQSLSVDDNTSSSVSAQTLAVSPTLTLTGAITPPTVNGVTLQANSTTYTGTNVYIAYNLAGAAAGGGVDQISIATPALPILQSSMQFPTLDVNNVYVSSLLSGVLFVTGNSSTADYPARLQRYSTSITGAIGAALDDAPLKGYAADSVKNSSLISNMVYAISGDNGGLTVLDSTALPSSTSTPAPLTVAISDARDISTTNIVLNAVSTFRAFIVTGDAQATVAASTGVVAATQGHSYIRSFDASGNQLASVDIGDTGAAQAKSTIQAGLTYGIATAGSGGFRVFCLADLGILATSTPIATGGVVNGAVYLAGYIFTAEGDQGVGVYALNQGTTNLGACTTSSLTRLGTINFGSSVSANNVSAVGSLLMVSGGAGGFKLVTVAPNALVTGLITTL